MPAMPSRLAPDCTERRVDRVETADLTIRPHQTALRVHPLTDCGRVTRTEAGDARRPPLIVSAVAVAGAARFPLVRRSGVANLARARDTPHPLWCEDRRSATHDRDVGLRGCSLVRQRVISRIGTAACEPNHPKT